MSMPQSVKIGQHWSLWVPGRRQWLLATVVSCADGRATLKFDARYKVDAKHDEQLADEITMLTTSNLFRFLEDA